MFPDFKNLIHKGEKFIMVENGKPVYVVMSYEDYEGMMSRKPQSADVHSARMDAGYVDEKGQRNASGADFNARFVMDTPNVPEDISKIRLEDLPL